MRRLRLGAIRAIWLAVIIAHAFTLESVVGDVVRLVVRLSPHSQPRDSYPVERVHIIVCGTCGILRSLRLLRATRRWMRSARGIDMADATRDRHVCPWLAEINVPRDFRDLALRVQ